MGAQCAGPRSIRCRIVDAGKIYSELDDAAEDLGLREDYKKGWGKDYEQFNGMLGTVLADGNEYTLECGTSCIAVRPDGHAKHFFMIGKSGVEIIGAGGEPLSAAAQPTVGAEATGEPAFQGSAGSQAAAAAQPVAAAQPMAAAQPVAATQPVAQTVALPVQGSSPKAYVPKQPKEFYTNYVGSPGSKSSNVMVAAVHNAYWHRVLDHAGERQYAVAAIYEEKWDGYLYRAGMTYNENVNRWGFARRFVVIPGPGGKTNLGRTQTQEVQALVEKEIPYEVLIIDEFEALP